MKIRKRLVVMIVMLFILTACGKPVTDKKDSVKSEKEESQKQNKEESADRNEDSVESQMTEDKSSTKTENEEDNNSSNGTTTQKPIEGNTMSNGSTTQNPTTEKPSNSSINTGGSKNSGSANNSGNTGGSNTTTTKKPVKRVSEEMRSAVVPYKYGVTKYDITTNYYTLYSDDSKELIDSSSYTVYDSTNYNASDSQLKPEADSNASKYASYYQEVLRLVNEIRAEVGVAPLTLDTTLCKAASMRALEMDYDNEVSHTRPNGSTCWTVLDFYGASYEACGENVAAGQPSASSVVTAWKNSPGHYENMVNPYCKKLGVGYSFAGVGGYGHYWCQLFTN